MTKYPIKLFECVCIIVSVGYAFIGNNGEINVFMFFSTSVFLKFKSGALCAESDEDRAGSEVVKMMINWRNSKGTEVGDEHAAVEGRSLVDDFGHKAEIIHKFKNGNEKADKKSGKKVYYFSIRRL